MFFHNAALLAEIKKISEEKSDGENFYYHFATVERQKSTPHQEFKYCDLNVHDDIHQLIKDYIPQICTPEQFDRVMKIWTSFVEPMFNVPVRPRYIAKNVKKTESKKVHKTLAQRFSSSRDNKSFKEREEGELSTTGENNTKETYQSGYHQNGLQNETDEEGEAEERLLETVKPITKYAPPGSHNDKNDPRVFYGSDAFYVFFRLHQVRLTMLQTVTNFDSR